MKEKRNVIAAYRSRYMNAGRKEKTAIREELRFITGYNRKYILRILNMPEAQKAFLLVKGTAVKLKPPRKKTANRTGKKSYTDEVIASLRLIGACFWYMVPLIRRQMDDIALWPAFGITPSIREKLLTISPATIDRALNKDQAALALKDKRITKPGQLLKHRITIRTFSPSVERKLPGFIQIATVGL